MNIHPNRTNIITPLSSPPAISLLTSAENLSISYALALHRLNIRGSRLHDFHIKRRGMSGMLKSALSLSPYPLLSLPPYLSIST